MSFQHGFGVRFFGLLLVSAAMAWHASPGSAQDAAGEDTLAAARAQLVNLFDQTEDLFYKAKTDENGNTFYTVVWESQGDTTKMIFGVRELGHYQGKKLHALTAWTYVATSDSPMPPAVIKAVATANDTTAIGNFSCSKDFTKVYANMSGVLEDATPGSLWMYCAYLHSNRAGLKEIVDQAMAGSGR